MEVIKQVELLSEYNPEFEQEYLGARQAEGRIYADEVVKRLPEIAPGHPLAAEWKMRKISAQMLVNFFRRKKYSGKLLEVGCGNGWLSNYIAENTELKVTGLDVNLPELEQANRVFGISSVNFFYGDIYEDIFDAHSFNVILFSSSLQYFSDVKEVLERANYFLKPKGSIIISDTPFYSAGTIDNARQNTAQYYKVLGFPKMANNYFHHLKNDILVPGASIAYDADNWQNKLLSKISPDKLPPFSIFEIKPQI